MAAQQMEQPKQPRRRACSCARLDSALLLPSLDDANHGIYGPVVEPLRHVERDSGVLTSDADSVLRRKHLDGQPRQFGSLQHARHHRALAEVGQHCLLDEEAHRRVVVMRTDGVDPQVVAEETRRRSDSITDAAQRLTCCPIECAIPSITQK